MKTLECIRKHAAMWGSGCTADEIAMLECIPESQVYDEIDQLEKQGLIESKFNPYRQELYYSPVTREKER